MSTRTKEKPLADQEPKPPFPKQQQKAPGLESKLEPRPRYEAESYEPADKLEGQGRAHHRRRLGHRPRGRGAVRARRRRRRDQLPARGAERRRGDRRPPSRRKGAAACCCPAISPTPGFATSSSSRRSTELGKLDILVSNAAHQNRKDDARRAHRRGARDDVQDQRLRLHPARARRARAHEAAAA